MLLTTKHIVDEQTFLIDEIYKDHIIPLTKKIAKQIDNNIRNCIKKEIRERGSIVKRYGDWAKFINKEIGLAYYQNNRNNYDGLFYRELFYRGNSINKYVIDYRGII